MLKINNQNAYNGVSHLGLGFMRMGPDDSLNSKLIKQYIEAGGNYFETCRFYLDRKCEGIATNLLKPYNRKDYNLCGKLAINGYLPRTTAAKNFQEQLIIHNTDYFDFYLIQAVNRSNIQTILDYKVIDYLNWKKQQGYIRNLGFSFHDNPILFEKMLSLYSWDCVQIQLNFLDYFNGVAKELYEIAERHNVPVSVMCATKGTLLGEDFPNIENVDKHQLRRKALMFLKQLDNCKLILRDVQNQEWMDENLEIFDESFQEKVDLLELENIAKEYRKHQLIQCTGCGYCLDKCPNHIDIREIFQEYNKAMTTEDKDYYLTFAHKINSYMSCTRCGSCLSSCPQQLNIPELFSTVNFNFRY